MQSLMKLSGCSENCFLSPYPTENQDPNRVAAFQVLIFTSESQVQKFTLEEEAET